MLRINTARGSGHTRGVEREGQCRPLTPDRPDQPSGALGG